MLDGLKRLFSRDPDGTRDWSGLKSWAQDRQWRFGAVRDVDGFVIEASFKGKAARVEWGPAQRAYIAGNELRLRAELPALADAQALLMTAALQAELEGAVFEQFVEGVQTRIDDQTPPEMRWLVMYTKLAGKEMGDLRERFVAVGPSRSWLQQWLTPAFVQTLQDAPVADDQPLVLMLARGRLTLRTPLQHPAPETVQPWVTVFEAAWQALPDAPMTVSGLDSRAMPGDGGGTDDGPATR